MGNPALCTGKMSLEVGLALGRGTDRFDAEHQDTLVRQPMYGIDVQTWKIVKVARSAEEPRVDTHMEQNRIAWPDLLLRLDESLLRLCDSDFMPQWNMAQIQTDRLGIEVFERHLIDRMRGRIGIEVARRVDMRTGVITHGDVQRLRAEARRSSRFDLVMVIPVSEDHRGMRGMRWRPMVDLAA